MLDDPASATQGGSSNAIDNNNDNDNRRPLADAVLIVRRGNRVAYANEWGRLRTLDQRPLWTASPPRVGRALAVERQRWWRWRRQRHGPVEADAEAQQFAADVARLRAAHPERAAELDALAAEYAAVDDEEDDEDKEDEDTKEEYALPALYPLDPAALVANLRSHWGSTAGA
ncbi:hypothetical protein SPI_06973 [Niveomyces insectorum RCEF 264]|uniref:Uncharacterized protein n=1 Tax=Niveomyces insectorum RCEF 264 TaxID=1081102 RepID=A0A167QY42_9HYPO|nr:hypothetical protein SPI_06973 [Niveomyces insectorum RCEF 264]